MEPEALLSVADLLQRGLDGASLPEVVPVAIDELRALAATLRRGGAAAGAAVPVLPPSEIVSRDPSHFNFCVASRTKSGKSFLVAAIAREMVAAGRVARVIILSADTSTAMATYDGVCPDTRVYAYLAERVLALIKAHERKRLADETPVPTLVVFDDIADTDIAKDKYVNALFTRGRHMNIWTCVASQQANCALAPVFKNNSRFIIFSQLPPKALGGLLDDMVLRPEMSPKTFKAWVAEQCERYTFALYDDNMRSLSLLRA